MSRLDKIREIVLANVTEGIDRGICYHEAERSDTRVRQVICNSQTLGTFAKLIVLPTSHIFCERCVLNHKDTWFEFEEEVFYGLPPE